MDAAPHTVTGGAAFSAGAIGNAAGELISGAFILRGNNGSEARKHLDVTLTYNQQSDGDIRRYYYGLHVTTGNNIKGMRVDTDNAGDMLQSGCFETWAALKTFP